MTVSRRDASPTGERALRLVYGGLAVASAVAIVAWEIVTPRLPVRFELAAPLMWVPRLRSAAEAALGIGAIFVMLARLADRRTALYAVVVLSTIPLWFVHARTATGAMPAMAGEALGLAGVALAVLDARLPRWARAGAIGVALAGAVAAANTRGLAVVVGPAAIGVGCAAAGTRRGKVALAIGVLVAASAAVVVMTHGEGALASWLAGPAQAAAGARVTFDAPVAAIAYGVLPWTPLLPIALARRPEAAPARGLALVAALAIAAHALLAPRAGGLIFLGAAPIACAIAIAARAFEDVPRTSIVLVLTIVAVAALVAHDVAAAPDRVLGALGSAAPIPSAYAAQVARGVRSATWLSAALAAVALATPRSWLPAGRGIATIAAGALAGLALRGYAYPALLARLSPGEAFAAYADRRAPSEPLGTLAIDTQTIPSPTTALGNAEEAASWLLRGAAVPERRFLALGEAELPRVNAAYRGQRGVNVPVLVGLDGSVLLAVSELGAGERSENPLDAIVMAAPPAGLRPMGARLAGGLEAIGWELVDDRGRPLRDVRAGGATHVRVAVRVSGSGASLGAYCTFLHVEHFPSRFSAEHATHPYPMTLWRAGDVILDDFVVRLPAQFEAGRHALFWGVGVLPCHDDRRMAIASGPDDGHARVPGGALEVR